MPVDSRSVLQTYRIPPDGAGKRLPTGLYQLLQYENGTHEFVETDYVRGQTSNARGEVVEVFPIDSTTGNIYVVPEGDTAGTFQAGENLILEETGLPVAKLTSGSVDIHVPRYQVVGRQSPFHPQEIDKNGAAYVRFTEGAQQLDAYGLTRVVQPQIISAYDFKYDIEPEDFHTATVGSGSVFHIADQHAVVLDVDSAAGSQTTFTSNVMYQTWPGSSHLVTMAVATGDSGQAGNVRRWGVFDAKDGFFFELSGTDLNVVHRSSATGVTVEMRISQSNWNTDPVSSHESRDGMILDPTKVNVYWINLQTMTAGRIVFGILNEAGERIILHNMGTINTDITPGARSITLPVIVDNQNGALLGAPARIKLFACSVRDEGPGIEDSVPLSRFSGLGMQGLIPIATGSAYTHLSTWRAGQYFKGVENGLVTLLMDMTFYVSGSTPVIIDTIKNTVLSTASWYSGSTNSPAEVTTTPATVTGGRVIHSKIFAPGTTTDVLHKDGVWELRGESMTRFSDGLPGDTYTIAARLVDPSGSASVAMSLNWTDIG